MKILIFFAAAFLVAQGQTIDCNTGLNTCEGNYNKSVPNDLGNHAVYCTITNVLLQCVQALAAQPTCDSSTVDRLRKKGQENIKFHNCRSTDAASQCQADLDACQSTMISGVAKSNHDLATQCKIAQDFFKCLDDRDKDPACFTKKSIIADLKKKYLASFSNAPCDTNADSPKLDCNADVKTCETRFISAVVAAGSDVKAACVAGSTLETCLQGREKLDECKSAKSTINDIRKNYKDQIDSDGCGSAYSMRCAGGIEKCTNTYNTAEPTLKSDDDKCKAANTYIGCLNDLSCSSVYRKQFQQAVTMVGQMVKGTSCTLIQLSGSATQNAAVISTTLLSAIMIHLLL